MILPKWFKLGTLDYLKMIISSWRDDIAGADDVNNQLDKD